MAFNQIVGSPTANQLNTTAAQDIVLASGGDDTITADFLSIDYLICGDGQDTVVTNLSYGDFSIQKHPGITDGYIVRYSGTNGKANIIKGVETFQFAEGSISLQGFLNGEQPGNTLDGLGTITLDGLGTIDNHEAINAGNGYFLYKDNINTPNFVVISDFETGDQLAITAGSNDIISIVNDGADVIITNNNSTAGNIVINSIILIGVVGDSVVYDEATFEQAIGFNALSII